MLVQLTAFKPMVQRQGEPTANSNRWQKIQRYWQYKVTFMISHVHCFVLIAAQLEQQTEEQKDAGAAESSTTDGQEASQGPPKRSQFKEE